MYFPFSELRKWSKKTAETRRRDCAVLPLILIRKASPDGAAGFAPQWQNPQKPLYKSFIFWRRDLAYFLAISEKKRYTVTEVCEKEVLGQP